MDPEVLKTLINRTFDFLERCSGSKRLLSFFVWLGLVLYFKPDAETLRWTVLCLLVLWLLFVQFPSSDGLAKLKGKVEKALGVADAPPA